MKIHGLMLCILVMWSHTCAACPTCVGRVSKQSAPFFSDECYHIQKNTCRTNLMTQKETDNKESESSVFAEKGEEHE